MVTHDVGAIGLQPFADILAWQTFIALNWPVPDPIAQRGIPDQQNIIGGFVTKGGEGGKGTSMPSGPTVWETYKDTADIYLNPPVRPTPFDAPEKIPAICAAQAAAHPEAMSCAFALSTATIVVEYKRSSGPVAMAFTIITGCGHHPESDCDLVSSGDGVEEGPVMCEDGDTARHWVARIEANGAANCRAETAGGL